MMETAERDPALSDTVAILEGLIAFEGRARDLLFRRRIARIADRTMSPFLTHDGAALAADLRALEAGLPRHSIMLHDLQPALESLAGHERSSLKRGNCSNVPRTSPTHDVTCWNARAGHHDRSTVASTRPESAGVTRWWPRSMQPTLR